MAVQRAWCSTSSRGAGGLLQAMENPWQPEAGGTQNFWGTSRGRSPVLGFCLVREHKSRGGHSDLGEKWVPDKPESMVGELNTCKAFLGSSSAWWCARKRSGGMDKGSDLG